jgi:hypothetical protein
MARKTKEQLQQKRKDEEAKNSNSNSSESDAADDDGMDDTPGTSDKLCTGSTESITRLPEVPAGTPAADAGIGLSGKNNGRSNNAGNR